MYVRNFSVFEGKDDVVFWIEKGLDVIVWFSEEVFIII